MHSIRSDPTGPVGVLLIGLGTPDSTSVRDVRNFLREFLSDPRVLTMPALGRWLLLHLVILRVRPRRSAEAYAKIWRPEGSPLLVHSQALRDRVACELGEDFRVELGMRYGRPELEAAIHRLAASGVTRILTLPLFPQNSEAVTGSMLARVDEIIAARGFEFPVNTIRDFCDAPEFIEAQAARARTLLEESDVEHIVLSYHGIPESQLTAGSGCLAEAACCDNPEAVRVGCYRAQCFATSRALIRALELPADFCTTAFQSRMGASGPWIRPFTDEVVPELAARGIRRLAVLCPSFTADCLETLEEINIRLREQWSSLGGESLTFIPCVNSEEKWVRGVSEMLRRATAQPAP